MATTMSPGCMLLFVFGFVGGAVVINSAVLVSLSVLLLVHYSVSNGLPAITLPRNSRYAERERERQFSAILFYICINLIIMNHSLIIYINIVV